jgi:ADP-heptose:LPS heptosyltransferase
MGRKRRSVMKSVTTRSYNDQETRSVKKTIQKVLIIRFSSIGDIVLTTPLLRCLKEQIPGVEIHYLVKKQFREVISANPYISRIWLFDDNFGELIPQLAAEKFDLIIDLHKNFRSSRVKIQLRRPSSSFPKINLRKWLIVNFRINILPEIHLVDRYFKALKPLGISNDGKGLDYFIPGQDEVDLSGLPSGFTNGFIAFVIGGKHATKILPDEKVAYICKNLDYPVILLGGKEDAERGASIISLAGNRVYNACGVYSINQSASLVRQAEQVITNDTGLMHIAAAFKKPVLSVWGNTIPGFGMVPYMPVGSREKSVIFEVEDLSCRPCSKIGYAECPKKHFKCMMDQDLESIIKTAKSGIAR